MIWIITLVILITCIVLLLIPVASDKQNYNYSVATQNSISAFAYTDPYPTPEEEEEAQFATPAITGTRTPPVSTMPTTNNPAADAAVIEINRFRATFGLPPMIYDVSKNPDADACAAYDAKNGYHASMKAGLTKGSSGQCECGGSTGKSCIQLYEREESLIQNPKSSSPVCGKITCGHWCIILGSYTHVSSGTSGNFSTQNFYNGRPRCSF